MAAVKSHLGAAACCSLNNIMPTAKTNKLKCILKYKISKTYVAKLEEYSISNRFFSHLYSLFQS